MKLQQPSRRRRAAGFSLLEMVIVLGIIAVIMGGAIFTMRGISGAARRNQVSTDFKTIESGLLMYQTVNGRFPTTQQGLDALVNKPSSTPVPKKWTRIMSKVPTDPWGEPYGYKFPGSVDNTTFELISKGADTQQDTDDDISSQKDE
ncbi:type II secretion system major pseudopilin GspG [Haloferula sargassicola]|uniref:Type II secretion system protein G n=1 Tax=Haloferula sargassicola TaxID=490096 RepID=A0ABP9UWW1_9BACT